MPITVDVEIAYGQVLTPCGGFGNDDSASMDISLRSENQGSPVIDPRFRHTVVGTGYQDVGLPSMEGRFFGLQTLGRDPVNVRLTREDASEDTITGVLGMFLVEVDPENPITAVALEGEGVTVKFFAIGGEVA